MCITTIEKSLFDIIWHYVTVNICENVSYCLQEWFYDELAMEEMEIGEEPEAESDEDYYDDTYANRRRRRGGITPTGPGSRGGRTRKSQPDDTPAKRGRSVSILRKDGS